MLRKRNYLFHLFHALREPDPKRVAFVRAYMRAKGWECVTAGQILEIKDAWEHACKIEADHDRADVLVYT